MAVNLLPHARNKWRARGYYVEGTESINRLPGGIVNRHDLFGFADLVALPEDGSAVVLIQVTSWANVPARIKKIRTESTGKGQHAIELSELARRWIESGGRIVVEGWRKEKNRWVSREQEITINELL